MTGQRLYLHQELLLLALRDDRGTAEWGAWTTQAIGGGILADLLLERRITTEGKRSLVTLVDATPTGEPLLDASLERIASAKRRAAAQRWVGRFATTSCFHRAAERLSELGVLRVASESVLLIFSRRVYPEVDGRPEREVVDRLRDAIFGESLEVEARTAALVSLAAAADLLRVHFPKKHLRARRARIEALKSGDAIGEATAAAIQAVQAAMIVATTVPVVAATS